MRILKSVIDMIDSLVSAQPPETGGIIGSTNGELIDKVVMDVPESPGEYMCYYAPNVDFLNENIEIWQNKGIEFKGVFHTHFVGVETLSYSDKQYIIAIMKAMPEEIKYLYFPIFVLPDRKMVCYKASLKNCNIEITRDELKIKI